MMKIKSRPDIAVSRVTYGVCITGIASAAVHCLNDGTRFRNCWYFSRRDALVHHTNARRPD